MYPYSLVGNCQVSALVSALGSVDWMCMPRPDSPPVFGKLLDPEGGTFAVEPSPDVSTHQEYIKNTNVVLTTFSSKNGSKFEIIDFCPRFVLYGRRHRPHTLFRIVRPISGSSRISVKCQPVNGWEKKKVTPIRGNSHLQYNIGEHYLRLTTNMPLTYLIEESSFLLQEPLYFTLSWDAPIEDDLKRVSEEFLSQTIQYWQTWVKYCSTPTLFQEETIRSALTLKLHCYEDTGAILAALTTSLPEEDGTQRNWDYRYCWLRDAYYVLSAFFSLGHFEEMEDFLKFLLNIANTKNTLSPVYKLDQTLPLPEIVHSGWLGYGKSGPVRTHNQAAEHIQNDVYGEMLLTLAPIFHDERFHHLRSKELEALVIKLVHQCHDSIGQPDAGLWEFRGKTQEHAFTNLMCWAGLDRAKGIKARGFLKGLSLDLDEAINVAMVSVERSVKHEILRTGPDDISLDAALIQLPTLRYPNQILCENTVHAIERGLSYSDINDLSGFLFRYKKEDDYGTPKSAFLLCSFWLIQSLVRLGEVERAKTVMKNVLTSSNHVGLLSEHFDPKQDIQLGNFPQCYSHVGVINAAFAISPPWNDVF